MSFSETDVQNALKDLTDPNTRKDFVSGKSVKNIKISGSDISLDILLGYPANSVREELRAMIGAQLTSALPEAGKIRISFDVSKTSFSRATIRFCISANAAPRWLIIGRRKAAST